MSNTSLGFSKKAKEWTTPQLLKGGILVSWGASLLLLATAISAVQGQREAIKTIGVDAAPSILNAQRIQDSLADMDANVVNELIAKPGQNQAAVDGYNKRREKLAKLLVAVAENITYDNLERDPIQLIQTRSGEYMQQVQQARDAHERGDEATMLRAYRSAAELMDTTLLPAAEKLAQVNNEQLDITYHKQQSSALISFLLVTISGLLLLGVLVGAQVFLTRRMRRVLNPGLVIATAIAVLFLGYTYSILGTSSKQIKIAKEDAFNSLYALRKGRSLSYRANADESRYLLDAQFAQTHEHAFQQKVIQIAQVPSGSTIQSIVNAAQHSSTSEFKLPGFQGFLADELGNTTFDGEKLAAVETLRTFGVYLDIDLKIRNLQQSGKHQQAVALCIGDQPGQSDWAFEQYKVAHQRVMDINMAEFQKAVEQGLRTVGIDTEFQVTVYPNASDAKTLAANEDIHILDTKNKIEIRAITRAEIFATSAIAAIALSTLLGVLPRLKEYSR